MAAIDPSLVGANPNAPSASPMPPTGVNPLIRIRSNSELAAEDRAAAMAEAELPHVSALANWVKQRWDSAKRAKYPHELLMLQDLRQRDGKYDPEALQLIRRSGGSEIYMMLTATKCRAAEAWIRDVLLPSDAKPWGLDPTPIPELPPDIVEGLTQNAMLMVQQDMVAQMMQVGYVDPQQQEMMLQQAKEAIEVVKGQLLDSFREQAREKANRMEDKIEDQLQEGGFYSALDDCIADLVTFPAAILKGPIVRRRKALQWVQDENGRTIAKVEEVFKTEFRRVSPFDIYPLPQTADLQEGGFFERQKLTVEELSAMIGVPGYSEAAIRAVIDEYAKGGLREWLTLDATRAVAEGRPHEYLNNVDTIEAVEFWGRVPGTLLSEWGVPKEDVPDRSAAYEANVWLVGHYVVRAAINPHPTGARPYGVASYEKVPGQIWGKGIPRLMRDCQIICNASARALANNMAIASGPQVAVRDIRRIPPGEDLEEMFPWKVWQFNPSESGASEPPLDFFQPGLIANQLLEIFGFFSRLADDYSGVIASAYGSDKAAGAGKTASGQAMLLTNASKVLAGVIGNVDRGIVERVVENQFVHNMLFEDDESIKGDLVVTAKGSSKLVVKEQAQQKRLEFLALALNPTIQSIIGLEGVRAILAETTKTLQLDKEIVPSEEELMQAAEQIALLQQQSAPMPPPDSAEAKKANSNEAN